MKRVKSIPAQKDTETKEQRKLRISANIKAREVIIQFIMILYIILYRMR